MPIAICNEPAIFSSNKILHQKQIDAIITEKTEAYILEKANLLGVQVEVRVELSKDSIPFKSIITGKLSQDEKKVLSAFLQKEIGIQEEMQIWR